MKNISLRVDHGQILALVGETGSGKTMTAHAVMGLLPAAATATGSIRVDGAEVLNSQAPERCSPTDAASALLLRDPRATLDPRLTIGAQLGEVLRTHRDVSRRDRRARTLDLLDLVDFPDPQRYLDAYPGQLTAGDRQRAAIALAMATDPALLVADEPTSTLDTGEQAAILALLRRLRLAAQRAEHAGGDHQRHQILNGSPGRVPTTPGGCMRSPPNCRPPRTATTACPSCGRRSWR